MKDKITSKVRGRITFMDANEKIFQQQMYCAKAIGWYLFLKKKELSQKDIAYAIHCTAGGLNRKLIMPKRSDEIIDKISFEKANKRILEISDAEEICRAMKTSLVDVIYFYSHREYYEKNPDQIDKLNKLPMLGEKFKHEVIDLNKDFLDEDMEKNEGYNYSDENFKNLIIDVDHPEFEAWYGRYFCYFSSTSSDEAGKIRKAHFNKASDDEEISELLEISSNDYIFCGILNIFKKDKYDDGRCHAEFKFLASPGKKVMKKYSGVLTISRIRKAVFCELISDEEGEITYLIIEKKETGSTQPFVRCSMAMVLTFSSKEGRRRPCCERMIISRDIIKEGTEEYRTMKANLLMNDNIIRITQSGYEQLINEIRESEDMVLKEIIEKFPNLESLQGQTVVIDSCAFIPEAMIYKLKNLSDEQCRKFEVLLRLNSISPWYCKAKSAKANDLFELMKSPHD